MDQRHEIIFRATWENDEGMTSLEVRCSCGHFILDRMGTPAEASLVEITQLVAAHYTFVRYPEKSNGNKGIKNVKT